MNSPATRSVTWPFILTQSQPQQPIITPTKLSGKSHTLITNHILKQIKFYQSNLKLFAKLYSFSACDSKIANVITDAFTNLNLSEDACKTNKNNCLTHLTFLIRNYINLYYCVHPKKQCNKCPTFITDLVEIYNTINLFH
jgi:hypothetical protein